MLKTQSAADRIREIRKIRKGAEETMIDNERTGRNIMILRLEKGLSQQGLAEVCGVTHQAVSKWENGAALPDIQTMLFLSRFFDTPMEEMLTRELSTEPAEGSASLPPERGLPAAAEAEAPVAPETAAQTDMPTLSWDRIVGLAPFASQQAVDRLIRDKLAARDGEKPEWGMLTGLMPFASRELITSLFEANMDSMDPSALGAIAPFVSREFLDRAVLKQEGQLDWDAVMGIVPFLSSQTVDRLLLGRSAPAASDPCPEKEIGGIIRDAIRKAMEKQPEAEASDQAE